MARRAVFPGSFDPLSVAHVAIADAARSQLAVDSVTLSITVDPIGKHALRQSPLSSRVDDIARVSRTRPWLQAQVTEARLLADVARGFDWLVVGADKWIQMHDVSFYGDERAMEGALARLPRVAVVPRAGFDAPPGPDVVVLDVDADLAEVSSTAIRAGRLDWRA